MTEPARNPHRDAYIELLKRAITNYLYLGGEAPVETFHSAAHYDLDRAEWKIEPLARPATLLTRAHLELVEKAVLSVEERGVPGDLLEAGIWRGGAIILMRALLDAYEIRGRRVFAADSFAGIPKNVRAINDPVDQWKDRWVASFEEVRRMIARFGLLDDRIQFVPGFFEDSLKTLRKERFSLIRLDSDSYDSVETSLAYLYPLLSKGGIVIIDDWHLRGCRKAVLDYREAHNIQEDVQEWAGNAYWAKLNEYGFPARA